MMNNEKYPNYGSHERNSSKRSENFSYNLLNELCTISSENKELKEYISQMKKTLEQNEKKVKTLEYKVIDNIDIRGKVTNTAFCLLEQKYHTQTEKLTNIQTEVVSLKNGQENGLLAETRIKSLEDEVSRLKLDFNRLRMKEAFFSQTPKDEVVVVKPKSSIVVENSSKTVKTKITTDETPTDKLIFDQTTPVPNKSSGNNTDILLDLYERMILDKAEQNIRNDVSLYVLNIKANYLKFEELKKGADLEHYINTYKCIFSMARHSNKITYKVEKAAEDFYFETWFESLMLSLSRGTHYTRSDVTTFESIYTLYYDSEKIEFYKRKPDTKLSFYFISIDSKPCFVYVKNSNFCYSKANLKKRANDYSGKKKYHYDEKENDLNIDNIVVPNPFEFPRKFK
jgi:hypothetical protein